jgi:hypothetical protein
MFVPSICKSTSATFVPLSFFQALNSEVEGGLQPNGAAMAADETLQGRGTLGCLRFRVLVEISVKKFRVQIWIAA